MALAKSCVPDVPRPRALLRELRRRSLSAFVEASFMELGGEGFAPNWHIDAITWHLEEVERGAIKRLIITLPPRHLKSFTATVAYPAWVLGRDPRRKVIAVSYSQDLAKNLSGEFRRIVELPMYRQLFPDARLSSRKNTETEQAMTSGGFRYATSVGGTLTGRGGDIIIVDDPIKADASMSDAERTSVNDWFRNSLLSRLDNKKEGAIVIVMQRLHEDDLVGHLTERDDHGWTVLKIPAIATENIHYRIGNGAERRVYHRKADEPIQAIREDLHQLKCLKRDVGELRFAAQYQQEPMPLAGNLIRREWIKSYAAPPEEFDAIIQSWDTASNGEEHNDFSVCSTWGVLGQKYYLLDLCRKKLDYPDLRTEAIRLARKHRPGIILIERAGVGFSLIKDLRLQHGEAHYPKSTPRGDKPSRVAGVSSMIEQGRMLIPADAWWRDTFLKELLAFPSSRHDDQVDSVEQFLRYMQSLGQRVPKFDQSGRLVRERRSVTNRR
ncbi:phage terminase large subunit [Aminobacter sp. Piv2-1]|uniref:phage terminase large subunit n=1 Tax=Aminobacter sp. Piv2-1 TaxID=3031122 RepID=UPI0030B1B37B